MRILCVAAYRSNHADRHLTLLAQAGFDVHLAEMNPAPAFGVLPGVAVHAFHSAGDTEPCDQESSPSTELGRGLGWTDRVLGRLHALTVPSPTSDLSKCDEERLLELATRSILSGPADRADRAAVWLAALIDQLQPDVLHSFALHQASFLTCVARNRCRRKKPFWIVSNWGCDIHYFGEFPGLRDLYGPAIRATLQRAQGYFAETRRDDRLARKFGFRGATLAIAPIGGGFDIDAYARLRSRQSPSRRRLIMVKGYQGNPAQFSVGHAMVAMQALHQIAPELAAYEVNLYAASHPDVLNSAAQLRDEHGIAVIIHPFLPYDDLMRLHGRARCSIGISETDGIATSAIEAMLMGSVPVQSDSSGLGEWIAPNGACLVPHDDANRVAQAISKVLSDDGFADAAVRSNDASLKARFALARVNPVVVRMYRRAAAIGAAISRRG